MFHKICLKSSFYFYVFVIMYSYPLDLVTTQQKNLKKDADLYVMLSRSRCQSVRYVNGGAN